MKLYLGPNTLLFPQTCYLEDPELMATSGLNNLRNAYMERDVAPLSGNGSGLPQVSEAE